MVEQTETGCCPKFNPEPWDKKTVTWQDKLFVKDHVTSFLHIPLNYEKVITRNMEKIEKAGASSAEWLMLSDENSLWGADLYIAVSKEVPGAENARISGTFMSKTFEGPYSSAGKWAKEMLDYVKVNGQEVKKMYFWYTTCPKCAKVYGKNYVVVLANV